MQNEPGKRSHSIWWLLLAVAFATGATALILSCMFTDPAHVIIQLGGDCGKNYFTYFYHSIFDHGLWLDGMNYPYGEHIIYGDGQPILSTTLQLFQPLSVTQVLAVMNMAISLSYILAIVFTYLILKRFGVQPFLAILFACLINLMSPQVFRARAHFALAYLNVVPMLFYFSILYHHTGKWKWAIWIFIMGFIMAFMHLYIGGMIFIWVAFYAFGYFCFVRQQMAQKIRHLLPVLLSAGLLFACIKVIVAATDPIKDRPAFPLNTLEYVTHIKDIIGHELSFFSQYMLRQKWVPAVSNGGEGVAYLGVPVILAVVFSFVFGIVRRIRKQSSQPAILSEQRFSPVWMVVAIGALCVAMGIPFIWNMQWLLNYLSLFKQFRAMGRFSWVFYYIVTIYGAVVIYSAFAALSKKGAAGRIGGYTMLAVVLVFWYNEAMGYVRYTRDYMSVGQRTYNEFFYNHEDSWTKYMASVGHKANDFQGIILFPFFMSGSEKLWVGGDPSWPLSIGMRASLEMHLPIVDVMMSRTSWSLTGKQVKTIAGPYTYKPMLRDLKSNKPFLLLHYDGEDVDQDQKYLLEACEPLGHHFQAYIFACYPDRIMANDRKHTDSARAVLPYMTKTDTCLENKGSWYVDHMDDKRAGATFFGTGSAPTVAKDSLIAAVIPVAAMKDNPLYEFSCWFLLDDVDYRSPYVNLQELDSAQNVIFTIDALTKQSVDNRGMWFRSSRYFEIKPECRYVRCVVVSESHPSYKIMDELLLRPANAIIVSRSKEGKVLVNNHELID